MRPLILALLALSPLCSRAQKVSLSPRLVDFRLSVRAGGVVEVHWSVLPATWESNLVVEKSIGDSPYRPWRSVKAPPQGDIQQRFVLVDSLRSTGRVHYRIREQRQDGLEVLSEVRSVTLEKSLNPLDIDFQQDTFNGSEIAFNVYGGERGPLLVSVFDDSGRKLFSSRFNYKPGKKFKFSWRPSVPLPAGNYTVIVTGAKYVKSSIIEVTRKPVKSKAHVEHGGNAWGIAVSRQSKSLRPDQNLSSVASGFSPSQARFARGCRNGRDGRAGSHAVSW